MFELEARRIGIAAHRLTCLISELVAKRVLASTHSALVYRFAWVFKYSSSDLDSRGNLSHGTKKVRKSQQPPAMIIDPLCIRGRSGDKHSV